MNGMEVMQDTKPKCPQCGGFVVYEEIHAEQQWIPQARCVNCGWIYQRPVEASTPGAIFRMRKTYKRKGGFWL